MRAGKPVVARIAAESGHKGDSAGFQDAINFKGVSADVVLAEQVYPVFALLRGVIEPHDMGEESIVSYVVSSGLTHALVTFATEREDVDSKLFLHLPRYGVHIVPD